MPKKILSLFILAVVVIAGFFLLSYQKRISVLLNDKNEFNGGSNITFVIFGKTGKVVGWNFSPDLADSILVVDYRPDIGATNLVSLPRDLYVNLGNESFKLNEVVRRKKTEEFLSKLPEMTGLQTSKYIVLNIDILKKIVDDLGGIDINLKSSAVDWVSGYTIKEGQNHLNGDQTVWLVRNRFSHEGDFYREKNQHEVVKALSEKFRNLNIIQKTTFLFKITPEIAKLDTNINLQEVMPLIEKFNSLRFNDVVLDFKTGLLESSTTTIGTSSAYILVPKNGVDKYGDIKSFISSRLEK